MAESQIQELLSAGGMSVYSERQPDAGLSYGGTVFRNQTQ